MSHSNFQKDNENKIKSNQFPHPLETKQSINEETKEEQKQNPQNKNSLLFEQKDISVIKLYCHLSEKLEILFMILCFIGIICSGASGPIISLLNCSTMNNFRDSTISNTPNSIMMEEFKKEIDKKIRIYLIMGAAMFLSHFLMTFMWVLFALRQMHHLKEKYFITILKKE